jgi:glycosyltransferase involved in cell wall biosynthesis
VASTSSSSKKEQKSKVGIFMPYYNMDEFFDEAIESLKNQTYKDFTVIIADDASPSIDTYENLSKVSHPNIKVFYEKKNLGLIEISNKYMAMLDAEYIMLFSPDDKMHPGFLKEQVEYLDQHQTTHAVCTWIQEFGDGNAVIKYTDELCQLPEMLVENHFSGAALMRKSAWLAAGKHDNNKKLYPNLDYDLWLSMLSQGFKLGTIQKPLFYWRVVRTSLSHGVNAEKTLIFRKALALKYAQQYRQYSAYVLNYYLESTAKFEDYYSISEEGHEWLDSQYWSLIKENEKLKEDAKKHVDISIKRQVYIKIINFFKKNRTKT